VLNPDTEPAPEALAPWSSGWHGETAKPSAAPSCCRRGSSSPRRLLAALAGPLRADRLRDTTAGPADQRTVESTQSYLSGASMLVGRRFLDVAGPMRETTSLLRGGRVVPPRRVRGDATGLRARRTRRSSPWYENQVGGALRDRPRMPVYLDERNKLLLTRDAFASGCPSPPWPLCATDPALARYHAWRQLSFGLAGWWAGLRGERGAPRWLRQSPVR